MEHIPDEILSILVSCPLFQGLSENQLFKLLTDSSGRIRKFAKGDLVAQAGDEVFFLHIMIAGMVKGEMIDFTGRVIKIEDIVPPRPLAPAFLYGNQNRYPVQITASNEVSILSIPREEFLKMMQSSERMLRNFVDNVSSRGQFLSDKIKFLSFTSIKGKLARYLLDLRGKTDSDQVTMPHSQSQLADLFGVTRPSVGRAMVELNQDGILKTEGKLVILLDQKKLSVLALSESAVR